MSDSEDDVPQIVNPSVRYEDLLRPCRDLAANWNVDIVSKLSEYLAELDIDINDLAAEGTAGGQINFQHAALVVEGGTCVYSRKVDYLYALVFAAADTLYEARGKALPSEKARTKPGVVDIDGTPSTDELKFLLLDDELAATQPSREGITLPLRPLTDNRALLRARDANRLVSVPLHLLPPGPQTSRRASGANQNTNGLRMPDAIINVSTGALILDGIGAGESDEILRVEEGPILRSSDAFVAQTSDDLDHACVGSFDSEDEVGDEKHAPLVSNGPEPVASANTVRCSVQKVPAPNAVSPVARREDPAPVFSDPYLPLDPHDPLDIPCRPVRRGKTWSRSRGKVPGKGAASPETSDTLSLLESVLGLSANEFNRRTNRFVSFVAVEDQFKANMRSIGASKRRRMRTTYHGGSVSVLVDGRGDSDLNNIGRAGSELSRSLADKTTTLFVQDDDDNFTNDFNDDDATASDEEDDKQSDGNSALLCFQDVELATGGAPNNPLDISHEITGAQIEQIATSYEEACRQYLLESSILWQEHSVDTQLEQRVSEWRSRIEPLLILEEERGTFDIQQYGERIIERFREKREMTNSGESDLCSLFAAEEPFEACRNFLAALQLVNNYKIDIVPRREPSFEDCLNPLVTLLLPSHGEPQRPKSQRPQSQKTEGTPQKERVRTPLRTRPPRLSHLASDTPETPKRRPTVKRNRQAGTTPVSARRALSRSRLENAAG
jgi:condensin-2 complex subunit H2